MEDGQSVQAFCDYVKTNDSEIDHQSLHALHRILLSPIDIALEVQYLDRSEGTEVNAYQWEPEAGLPPMGHVRLLYRP
jgi:ubiquitin thioesterase protein OTUB1